MSADAHNIGMPLFRSSPPTIAIRDTDQGNSSVTRPGRCLIAPSWPHLPGCRPSRARLSGMVRNLTESTAPEGTSAAAPRPAQALASSCGACSGDQAR